MKKTEWKLKIANGHCAQVHSEVGVVHSCLWLSIKMMAFVVRLHTCILSQLYRCVHSLWHAFFVCAPLFRYIRLVWVAFYLQRHCELWKLRELLASLPLSVPHIHFKCFGPSNTTYLLSTAVLLWHSRNLTCQLTQTIIKVAQKMLLSLWMMTDI